MSPSPSSSESPSPTASPTFEGNVSEKIIRLAGPEYLESVGATIDELGGEIFETYDTAIQGYAARLSAKDALLLAQESGVEAIEENIEITLNNSAIRTDAFCSSNSLGKTDDGGTFGVPLTFTANWYGITYDEILINNNGGVSFNDNAGQFTNWATIDLNTADRPLILPLFTDIDTTNSAASAVTYGSGNLNGANAFCVNWINVGEYDASLPRFSFQLMLIDRSSTGNAGDFDIEMNYSVVGEPQSWTNGKFSVGYAVPHSRTDSLVRVSPSDSPALYADGGTYSLTANKYPSSEATAGRYTFPIRPDSGGTSPTPEPVPTPIGTAGNCDNQTNPSTTLAGYTSTYCGVVWGLDRIDQRTLPLNSEYSPIGTGSGVQAYVVDTGLNASHSDFTGRVGTGRNFYTLDGQSATNTDDCNGHGTHVSSTLAGSTYGVAKDATVIPIRVFGCSGSTSTAIIISALDWIAANHSPGTDAVVNMSLGGGPSTSLDQAVQCLAGVGSGCTGNNMTVAVAAGNENSPASGSSPARVAEAITVGSTTSSDARSSFSNYGSAVDIFAPGSGIKAAWIGSSTATATISGTSMASPHAAGAAAIYLQNNPGSTPAQVLAAFVDDATPGSISNPGLGSPNKLLFIGGLALVTAVSPDNAGTAEGATVTITGENLDDATVNDATVEFGLSNSATVTSESDSELVVVSPVGTAGAVDLIIDNGRGKQTITGAFTYTASTGTTPSITSVTPDSGPVGGGTDITISGTDLVVGSEATSVLFGTAPGVVTASSDTELTVRSPEGVAGAAILTVRTSAGADTTTFTYVAPPGISALDVQRGPVSGGTTVTATGENLGSTTRVQVGEQDANLGTVTDTSVQFTTPQRPLSSANSYDVVLYTSAGTVTVTSGFTYVEPPTISAINAASEVSTSTTQLSGPSTGGTGVRITGTNLNEVTLVEFGDTSANFSRESSTSLVAVSPAGSGDVALTVTSPGGSATRPAAFTYVEVPTTPVVGSVLTGDRILFTTLNTGTTADTVYYRVFDQSSGGTELISNSWLGVTDATLENYLFDTGAALIEGQTYYMEIEACNETTTCATSTRFPFTYSSSADAGTATPSLTSVRPFDTGIQVTGLVGAGDFESVLTAVFASPTSWTPLTRTESSSIPNVTSSLSLSSSPIQNDSTYYVARIVRSLDGFSSWTPREAVTPLEAPPPPTGSVTFSAPTRDGDTYSLPVFWNEPYTVSLPVGPWAGTTTGYRIDYSTDGLNWVTAIANTGSTSRSATIDGLSPGSYYFRVAGISASGAGAFKMSAAVTLSLIPQTVTWAPSNTSVSGAPGTITPDALATTDGDGSLSYSVGNPGTTACTVDSSSGLITYTTAGTCEIVATADATATYAAGTATVSFTITQPSPAPPSNNNSSGGSASSSSGGSSSSSSSSAGGGGGGLNSISTIVPATSGAPGATIALAGWGLETTRDVKFNDTSAQFRVINGGQVEVVVPNVPPGTYVIHAVLAPSVGRASFWDGFSVLGSTGAASSTPVSDGQVAGNTPALVPGSVPAAEFVTFSGTKTKMTKATRSKLASLAEAFDTADSEATIVTYTNKKGTKASVRRAKKRAANMRRYLVRSGFEGTVTIRTEPGDTKTQRRGAMVYVEPAGSAQEDDAEGVTSLIVRLKKGLTPVVDGEVRGADNVPDTIAANLSVGRSLGLRMYRIDFAEPVSEELAARIADDLMEDSGVVFAEPDSVVSTQVSIAS